MPGDLDSTLNDLVAHLREQVAAVDDQRAQLRADYLAEDQRLKNSVTKARRLIAANDNFGRKLGKKVKQPPNTKQIEAAQAKIDRTLEWLQTNMDGEEFIAPMLWADEDFVKTTGISYEGGVPKALAALHERGAIRLVRQGRLSEEWPGNRSKIWKVT